MRRIKGEKQELKGYLTNDWILDIQSDKIKNLLGGGGEISVRASMIAKNLAENDEKVGGDC